MTTILNEDEVGQDPSCIGYPNLLLCMGVTFLMSDGSLIGAHFSSEDSEDKVADRLKRLIGASSATPQKMYMTGNFELHRRFGGGDYRAKAEALEYRGPIYCFDTAQLKPKYPIYVQLTSKGAKKKCLVEYKNHEKMSYEKLLDPANNHITYTAAFTTSGSKLHTASLIKMKV